MGCGEQSQWKFIRNHRTLRENGKKWRRPVTLSIHLLEDNRHFRWNSPICQNKKFYVSISLAYRRAHEVLRHHLKPRHESRGAPPRCFAAFDGQWAIFSNDYKIWLSSVEFEVKRRPFQGSLRVLGWAILSCLVLVNEKIPGVGWEKILFLVRILFI